MTEEKRGPMKNFQLSNAQIADQLNTLAETDKDIDTALKTVGYPKERTAAQSFGHIMRVIIGQQVSVKAAAAIAGRVADLVGENPQPADLAKIDDDALRAAGLSRPKIKYVRSLCETVSTGILPIEKLPEMSDEEAIAAITAVKGLGVWSAHMYLMFSLGRPDIWPVGDLAVRVGAGRIIGMEDRPTEKEAEQIGERWRPYRSAVALLSWHYYSNAPF